ncbi:MAG: alanine--tRNA ligase [Planctomycetes bacterium]|nr:alanine--tRNA ligase [Planctomycetota bacterium]
MKTAHEIRNDFLEFFRAREHRVVPSAPVFPQDDPTLLFTNAGMNQFKDVFLGNGTRDYARAADTQKCIRVSGKHNDLEEVGVDTYHHTFFEMLGNWSFGDYFKREAIAWAWELLTKTWGMPKDRLWVTVFGGDEADGLPADDEAAALWAEVTDIDPSRILKFGKEDNFWEMGDTGPCGPCTEIHIDRGGPDVDPADGANRKIGVNAGNERFIELWNNVFIQFNRRADGSLDELPAKHVDTGMGFERVCAVLQGKSSNYDTDVFTPIFATVAELTGKSYEGTMDERDIAFRVVADHVRAVTAGFSDGALPSNEGRGYVLRRLIRRAARYGRQALGMPDPFLYKVVPTVAEILGDSFPEMRARQDHVMHLVESEEKAFAVTLDKGLVLFEDLAGAVLSEGMTEIPGQRAFDLYATYGFPRDLVELMAREQQLTVDSGGWDDAEAAHKLASKGAGRSWLVDPEQLEGVTATQVLCYHRDGHDGLTASANVVKLIDGTRLVVDRSPFYAESGGQVGDAGEITGSGFRFRVDDTQKMGDVIVHVGELIEGAEASGEVRCVVDGDRRHRIMANHTATHLLHWALLSVLGDHANQQGSLVAPNRLRFDVTHPRPITPDEIERMESLINEKIVGATPLATTVEDLAAAKERGVTALFGEKYDERVRVVDIGGYSTELCGGTHCLSTGQIGAFAIVNESAVQAGVRRLEAVTRDGAIVRMQEQRRLLREATTTLKAPESELVPRIQALQSQLKELKKGGAKKAQSNLNDVAKKLLDEGQDVGSGRIVVAAVEGIDPKNVSGLCDALRKSGSPTCGVIGIAAGEKAILAAFASEDLAGSTVHAGNVVKAIAKIVGGGGGGRPDFAQAGGKDPSKIDEALAEGRRLLTESLS